MDTAPQFPKGFLFGSATAAYQIEGGHDADGKGPSTWDMFVGKRGKIRNGDTGRVACDTYRNPGVDIGLMADLGHNAYRFSVAWSRVLPEGRGCVNQPGLDYYDRLVDALLERGIAPFVTLFHWDMPLAIYRANRGFVSRDTASYFADYAEVVAKALGDRVKHWITLNEPWEHAMFGHFLGEHAPGHRNPWKYFKVAHHQLLGHGLAIPRIRSVCPGAQVGITLSRFPSRPVRETERDIRAARFADLFVNGFFMDGIYRGHYPDPLMRRLWPFRPRIKEGDMDVIATPTDFLGINYYSPNWCYNAWYIPFFRAWIDRSPPEWFSDPDLGKGGYPAGIHELCMEARNEYGNPAIYITENGTGAGPNEPTDGVVADNARIAYLRSYLRELARAIDDGADVRGYFYWTLMDNFEWYHGFSLRMGLIHVNHQTQRRTVKQSGYWYRDFINDQRSRWEARR